MKCGQNICQDTEEAWYEFTHIGMVQEGVRESTAKTMCIDLCYKKACNEFDSQVFEALFVRAVKLVVAEFQLA